MAIALGANLGDRRASLSRAAVLLSELVSNLRMSSVIETLPVGIPDSQPPFLNAVCVGETTLDARALLDAMLAIEAGAGRIRPYANAPRTLDLDLILYGDAVVDEAGLTVPHPRFRERLFVLEPLAEIAPALRDPKTGLTVDRLLRQLKASSTGAAC